LFSGFVSDGGTFASVQVVVVVVVVAVSILSGFNAWSFDCTASSDDDDPYPSNKFPSAFLGSG
jgi:hypothetical protein